MSARAPTPAVLPLDPHGKLYQRRAARVMPLLVRQAHAAQPIYYSALAAELGMPNPRNLDFVLGSVGAALTALSAQWQQPIPVLQALVINRATHLPGKGFIGSLPNPRVLAGATARQRKQIIDGLLADVYAYPRWAQVLHALGLPEAPRVSARAILASPGRCGQGGESDAHRMLKAYVAAHPRAVGVPQRTTQVSVEHWLPTGDEIDVLFQTRDRWIAVEVKSHLSDEADIERGLFQCVKYEALLHALAKAQGLPRDVDVVLALGGIPGAEARALANVLGITVCERVGGCTGLRVRDVSCDPPEGLR